MVFFSNCCQRGEGVEDNSFTLASKVDPLVDDRVVEFITIGAIDSFRLLEGGTSNLCKTGAQVLAILLVKDVETLISLLGVV